MKNFVTAILKSYSGSLSGLQKSKCQRRIKEFNQQNQTNYWVQFGKQGESDTYDWLAIREGGENGKLLKRHDIRDKNLRMIYASQLEALDKEEKDVSTRRKITTKIQQLNLF